MNLTKLKSPRNVWTALAVIGVGWEIYSISRENGATVTETTRDLWRLHTPAGKWLFLTLYGAVVSWYPAHLLKSYEWDKHPSLYEMFIPKKVVIIDGTK